MSNRYAPLPTPRSDHNAEVEMEAAFDYSDDEDDDENVSESKPLNPTSTSPSTTRVSPPHPHTPGEYDFESIDYASYPPPGSPPPPSAVALPNEYGNSNGLIPTFNRDSVPSPRKMWLQRAAVAILPTPVAERLGLTHPHPAGPIGGGINNDGVFANVTAKPSAPVRIQDGDDTYVVPEDSQREAPPSYASAQADAVPPYWETTVHAPFSPDSAGDMIVDSLPTGSIFSFLWNMAVSISFQFIGFLLTYLMHSSHASRMGSRAGLGVTLINFGFALRSRLDSTNGGGGESTGWGESWKSDAPHPIFSSAAEANAWYSSHEGAGNATSTFPSTMSEEQANMLVADATTEWLSFFVMTMGWFILLISVLSFWRIKRWERGILASQRSASGAPADAQPSVGITSQLEQMFALRGISRGDFFRQGFGLSRRDSTASERDNRALAQAEEGEVEHAEETDFMIPVDHGASDEARRAEEEAIVTESRLRSHLRNAGLI